MDDGARSVPVLTDGGTSMCLRFSRTQSRAEIEFRLNTGKAILWKDEGVGGCVYVG